MGQATSNDVEPPSEGDDSGEVVNPPIDLNDSYNVRRVG